jgi:hypothetical protein
MTLGLELTRGRLHQDGFVKLERFLDCRSVELARELVDGCFRVSNAPVSEHAHGSMNAIDHLVRTDGRLATSTVFVRTRALAPELMRRPVFRTYDHAIYKAPGSSEVAWHQDDAFKSTVKHMRSLHFWIPLQDTDEPSGCMRYVKSSHRGPALPHRKDALGQLFVDRDLIDLSSTTSCEAKLGDVIVHTPRTLHSSFPVTCNLRRRAWILHFGPYGRLEPFMPDNLLHNLARIGRLIVGR